MEYVEDWNALLEFDAGYTQHEAFEDMLYDIGIISNKLRNRRMRSIVELNSEVNRSEDRTAELLRPKIDALRDQYDMKVFNFVHDTILAYSMNWWVRSSFLCMSVTSFLTHLHVL